MNTDTVEIAHGAADRLVDSYSEVFGTDLVPYRGHVHRVIGLVGLQTEIPQELAEPLGVAAFCHDAAIWFEGTWDYLAKSIELALSQLGPDHEQHADVVTAMIDEHHRIRKARHDHELVEAFRKADRYDIFWGLAPAKGVTRSAFRELRTTYPDAGFRRMLLRAFRSGLRENPRRPLPMIKL